MIKNDKYVINSGMEEEAELSCCCRSPKCRVPQYLAAAAVTIGGFSLGNCLGYSSPALPDLKRSQEFPDLESSDISWIGSLLTIGALCGAFFSGYCVEKIGRKKTLLAVGVPFTVGWFTIALAQNVFMLYAGRFLTGFSVGALSLVAPVYLSEISQKDIRGFLGAVFQVTVTLGILFAFIVGSMTSWRILAGICGMIPFIFTVLSSFLPESPRYLLALGCTNEATKALSWLRASDPMNPSKRVLDEIDEMEETVQNTHAHKVSYLDLIKTPILKPLLITLGLMFFNQFCGFNAVGFYTVSIFEEADIGIDAYLSSIVVGIVQVIATALASVFVDKAGRRVLLIFSFALMAISLLTLGTFFRMKSETSSLLYTNDILKDTAHWIPLVSVILFNSAYCGGVGCLVWTVMSEILPSHVIGFASGVAITCNWTLAFLTTKFFHDLNESLGIHNTFWLFSGACVLGLLFIFVFVPETKGKTLDMIQKENFQQNQNSSNPSTKSVEDIRSVANSTLNLV